MELSSLNNAPSAADGVKETRHAIGSTSHPCPGSLDYALWGLQGFCSLGVLCPARGAEILSQRTRSFISHDAGHNHDGIKIFHLQSDCKMVLHTHTLCIGNTFLHERCHGVLLSLHVLLSLQVNAVVWRCPGAQRTVGVMPKAPSMGSQPSHVKLIAASHRMTPCPTASGRLTAGRLGWN